MTYRAGIVGCGRVGCGFDDDARRGYVSTHAGAYVRTPGMKLVALADVDGEKLHRYGEKYGVRGRYESYEQMLDRERLDLVSICTWNDTHRAIVEKAVEAGVKMIFCEKPLARSLAEADAMIRRCAERGVLLAVDHQRRFDRLHQQIASLIHQDRLGRIQQVTCYYTAGLANTGSHLFDLLRWFFGEVAWVQGLWSRNRCPNPEDPNVDGWMQFEGGPLAVIQACDVTDYAIFELTILGTLGRLRLMTHGFEVRYEEARDSARLSGYRELYATSAPFDVNGPREFMLQAMAHLRECLAGAQQPLCSGQDGRRALELVCAFRQSAEAGGDRIPLPLETSPMLIPSR